MPAAIEILAVGGPTAVIDIGGLRLVTDPTFDDPGTYASPSGATLTKTAPPGLHPADIGRVDAVLLSHDQHPDNLDTSGRAFLTQVPLVVSTPAAAARLGGVPRALAPWAALQLPLPGGNALHITAVPARHGPPGCEALTGEVTGFVLTGPDLPTVYVSGDNASLANVRLISERFRPVDVAIIFAGAARTGIIGNALLTLDSTQAAQAAQMLGATTVVPLHYNSWAHFTEDGDCLRRAFENAGLVSRLMLLPAGGKADIPHGGRCHASD